MQLGLKERLRSHLQELARERDPYLATQGHFYVQHYIQQEFRQFGTVERHEFNVHGRMHTNWILNLAAAKHQKRPTVLIGGRG